MPLIADFVICVSIIGRYSGDAGDALHATGNRGYWYHDGMKFSTYDQDNDLSPNSNCAAGRGGGMWYNRCFYACLTCDDADTEWASLPGDIYLLASRMMIKAN